jgi:hypothetical protein
VQVPEFKPQFYQNERKKEKKRTKGSSEPSCVDRNHGAKMSLGEHKGYSRAALCYSERMGFAESKITPGSRH